MERQADPEAVLSAAVEAAVTAETALARGGVESLAFKRAARELVAAVERIKRDLNVPRPIYLDNR